MMATATSLTSIGLGKRTRQNESYVPGSRVQCQFNMGTVASVIGDTNSGKDGGGDPVSNDTKE